MFTEEVPSGSQLLRVRSRGTQTRVESKPRRPVAPTMPFCTKIMFCSAVSCGLSEITQLPVTPGMCE